MTPHLPFSSVVGQDDAKLALLLAAVEPRLGGVLLRGDKGSAKTTLARGLAAVLPGDAPFVELPVGAGEDRVVGALDVAALLESRAHALRPGLLAAAHGGVLYVDEVNLLPDHLVDVLLDVAVSGVNRVERDGFSQTHPARFVLVGSMNPEEGELRPQLLDRFGLAVDVRAPDDPAVRAEIVRRQLAFESTGRSEPSADDGHIRRSLVAARPAPCGEPVVVAAARLAVAVGAQGLRADLSLCRAAGALAGLQGAPTATAEHLRRVAPLVLGHRRRRDPFEAPGIAADELASALDDALGGEGMTAGPTTRVATAADDRPEPEAADQPDPTDQTEPADHRLDRCGRTEPTSQTEPADHRLDRSDRTEPADRTGPADQPEAGHQPRPADQPGAARRGQDGPDGADGGSTDLARALSLPRPARSPQATHGTTRGASLGSAGARGRRIGHQPFADPGQRVDAVATAVAHATRTAGADQGAGAAPLVGADLRAVVAAEPQATLVVLAVDASGSIAGRRRLEAARAAVLALLGDAYRRRDRVAMVAFRGESAEVVLRPTGSIEVARARLAELPSGGRTPLAAGLRAVTSLVRAAQRPGGPRPAVVLVTDGRATAGGTDPLAASEAAAAELATTGVPCLVVDAETGPARLGLARSLATTLSAEYVLLQDIERHAPGRDQGLVDAIRSRMMQPAGEGG